MLSKMIKRLSNYLTAAATLFFLIVLCFAIPTFFDPEFEVINNTQEEVVVVALWKDSIKTIGKIQPKGSSQFSLKDEAGITFKVSYNSGKEVISEPVYFTRGIKVMAEISSHGILVYYDRDGSFL